MERKSTKRLISVLLVLMMAVTLLPTFAAAAGGWDDYITITNNPTGWGADKNITVIIKSGGTELARGSYTLKYGINNALELSLKSDWQTVYKINAANLDENNAIITGGWTNPEQTRIKFTFYTLNTGSKVKLIVNLTYDHTVHTFEEVSRTAATCTEDGVINKKCKFCAQTDTETIPMIGHAWGDWVYDAGSDTAADHSDSTHSRTCANDAGHTEGQACTFAIDTTKYIAPTKTTEGSNTYVCSVCGHSYVEIIPATMKYFNVTYDANGGSGGLDETTNIPEQDDYPLEDSAFPTHFDQDGDAVVFIGWTAAKDETIYTKDDTAPTCIKSITLDADKTVWAVWGLDTNGNGTADVLEDQYSLTYDANGGTGAPAKIEGLLAQSDYELESTTVLTHPDVNGIKVVFCGWTAAADTKIYTKNDTPPAIIKKVDIAADTVVYAVYGEDTNANGVADVLEDFVTLTYFANGGEGAPASEIKAADNNGKAIFTVSATVPTRSEYAFKGWSTTADGTAEYEAGDSLAIGEDVSLYAVWEQNQLIKYTVTYDANGGKNAPAAQSAETRTGSGELVITSATPTRNKYTFLGWSQSKSGSVQLKPGDKVTLTEDMTLYAIWAKKTDTVKTGDDSSAALWFALAGLSAMCMFGATFIGKKRRKD